MLGRKRPIIQKTSCKSLFHQFIRQAGHLPQERKQIAIQNAEQERLAKELAIEQVEQERLAKELAIEQKEIAIQKVERLAERLRAMGINPDDL